ERGANVHLAPAARDVVGRRRVDADERDEQRHAAECNEELRLIAPAGERQISDLLERTRLSDGRLRIDLANRASNRRRGGQGIAGGPDQDRKRGPAAPPVRHVDHQRRRTIEPRDAGVAGDPDDLESLLALEAATEAFANRVLARPQALGGRLRDHGGRWPAWV